MRSHGLSSTAGSRNRPPARRRFSLLAGTLLATLVVAGCGSSEDDTTAGGASPPAESTAASSAPADGASAALAAAFKGVGEDPPTTGPKKVAGKTLWLIGCPGFEGCRQLASGIDKAAKEIGWQVKSVDSKGDPTTAISAIKSAVSAKADGIVQIIFDCPAIKAGLLAAKAAKIPVLGYGGLDCDDAAYGGKDEPLFAAPANFGGGDTWGDYYRGQGKRSAAFVSAKVKELGIAKPKILFPSNRDQELTKSFADGAQAELKASCPECSVKTVPFTIAQLGAGKGLQIFKSGILANPDADVFFYSNDAYGSLGLNAAVDPKIKQFKLVCCGDGGLSGFDQVRKHPDAWAINAQPIEWAGWALIDTMNRVFAGESTFPAQGGKSVFVDAGHNLPAAKEYALGSYDYAAAYKAIWGP